MTTAAISTPLSWTMLKMSQYLPMQQQKLLSLLQWQAQIRLWTLVIALSMTIRSRPELDMH